MTARPFRSAQTTVAHVYAHRRRVSSQFKPSSSLIRDRWYRYPASWSGIGRPVAPQGLYDAVPVRYGSFQSYDSVRPLRQWVIAGRPRPWGILGYRAWGFARGAPFPVGATTTATAGWVPVSAQSPLTAVAREHSGDREAVREAWWLAAFSNNKGARPFGLSFHRQQRSDRKRCRDPTDAFGIKRGPACREGRRHRCEAVEVVDFAEMVSGLLSSLLCSAPISSDIDTLSLSR
jgi:hypothetical protein